MKEVNQPQAFCEVLNRDFHIACPYYDRELEPLAELIDMGKGETIKKTIDDIFIYYIIKGTLHLARKGEKDCTISAGHLILLPIGIEILTLAEDDCRFIACRMRKNVHLCLSVTIDDLYWETMPQMKKPIDSRSSILEANEFIKIMLDSFVILLEKGVRCTDFIENKFKELLMLLRVFYPKEMLAVFFSPLLSGDALFKRKVLEYYPKTDSIKELASMTNYSLNGFLKKFKKNMGETPSRWIKQEKARKIHKELVYGEKPLKLIAEEYGFSSISYFNQFCKKNLGNTPGKIRNSVISQQ